MSPGFSIALARPAQQDPDAVKPQRAEGWTSGSAVSVRDTTLVL